MSGNRFRKAAGLAVVLRFGGAAMSTGSRSDAQAAEVKDYVVMVTATVQDKVPRVTLHWPGAPGAKGCTVYRRLAGAAAWGPPLASLPGDAVAYADGKAKAEVAYEYKVARHGAVQGFGYACSGVKLPLVEDRGKVVLVVDQTFAGELDGELRRLEADLAGDGWTVLRNDVARTESPPAVKAIILKAAKADPKKVKAVFLFGHVPVALSGFLAPDGHNQRPWPADLYYGDVTGSWTDTQEMDASNTAGDGKFDPGLARRRGDRGSGEEGKRPPQEKEGPKDPGEGRRGGRPEGGNIPADVALQVGRVDLYDLPAFAPKTEADLLRQYLNKDHDYRHKILTAPRRGLVDDNFGEFRGEAFAQNGWRNFAPLVGTDNVAAGKWNELLPKEPWLWAYGCGPGGYEWCGGVTTTADIARLNPQAIFTMLFGSFFGEWNSKDNITRATLASGSGLACAWAGRPHWFFHPMGMGETIGYCTRLSQNNTREQYEPTHRASRSIHVALMGDPTLRLHVIAPVKNLQALKGKNGMQLSWGASPDQVIGYNVYRSASPAGPFERLNKKPLTANTFTDARPPRGAATWMVRAVALETSATGSYYNASTGVCCTPAEGQ